MDFTYPFAFFIAVVISAGLSLCTIIFVKQVPASCRWLIGSLTAAATLAISIDWNALWNSPPLQPSANSLAFLLVDFSMIVAAAALGALTGTLLLRIRREPAISARKIFVNALMLATALCALVPIVVIGFSALSGSLIVLVLAIAAFVLIEWRASRKRRVPIDPA